MRKIQNMIWNLKGLYNKRVACCNLVTIFGCTLMDDKSPEQDQPGLDEIMYVPQ